MRLNVVVLAVLMSRCFAASLEIIVQPRDTQVGAVINPGSGVKVKLLDNLGKPLRNENIRIAIGANPPGNGRLAGTLTQTTDPGGTATFAGLRIGWVRDTH